MTTDNHVFVCFIERVAIDDSYPTRAHQQNHTSTLQLSQRSAYRFDRKGKIVGDILARHWQHHPIGRACRRDIASTAASRNSRATRGSEAASASRRKRGKRATTVSATTASTAKWCFPLPPKPKTSPDSSKSTICRLPSALAENRRAMPETIRYQYSTGLSSL